MMSAAQSRYVSQVATVALLSLHLKADVGCSPHGVLLLSKELWLYADEDAGLP